MKWFNVGKFMKSKKAKILMETEEIKGLDEEMRNVQGGWKKRKKIVEAKKKEVRAKEKQLRHLCTEVNHNGAVII